MSQSELALGMGGHHRGYRGEQDEWLTPPAIVNALGPFDLDPCSPITRPWPTAARHLTIDDDGLTSPWEPDEFVWCNPPYGPVTWDWMTHLATHPAGGIGLIFARTETAGFVSSVWAHASALLFLHGRITFHLVDGKRAEANSGAPSVLVGYGDLARDRLAGAVARRDLAGTLVVGWR